MPTRGSNAIGPPLESRLAEATPSTAAQDRVGLANHAMLPALVPLLRHAKAG